MALLDLQGMQAPGGSKPPPGGSGLTLLTCASQTPSNVSLAL